MSRLYMGKVDRKNKSFTLAAESLEAHSFITGQSGCGKSQLLARLLEEILLRNVGNVLLFDYNYEFSKFDQINDKSFTEPWNKENCPEDTLARFQDAWRKSAANFKLIGANQTNIRYNDVTTDQKAHLYDIVPDRDAGAYWLIQLIDQTEELSSKITSAKALQALLSSIERWFEGRTAREEKNLRETICQLRQHVTMLDLTKFANGVNRLSRQAYVNFEAISSRVVLNEELFQTLYGDLRFCGIDLLNFSHDDHIIRDFVTLHTLRCVWNLAKERYLLAKADNASDRKPLFIVIDEAHNIMPEGDEVESGVARETIRLLRTIAAEGRKFGLFLILISQRPNKVNSNILSECDNYIVMKSTFPTIELVKKLLPLKASKKRGVDKAFGFGKGTALYCGKFTAYTPILVEGDIKRTK
jgi:energy-coupling factor transporter ATP-binding protein EcfA2